MEQIFIISKEVKSNLSFEFCTFQKRRETTIAFKKKLIQ